MNLVKFQLEGLKEAGMLRAQLYPLLLEFLTLFFLLILSNRCRLRDLYESRCTGVTITTPFFPLKSI